MRDDLQIHWHWRQRGNGKFGAVAVDHVQAIDERNAQAGFLHSHMLVEVGVLNASQVVERAHLAFLHHFFVSARPSFRPRWSTNGILNQLADLFLQGHFLQEGIDFFLDTG